MRLCGHTIIHSRYQEIHVRGRERENAGDRGGVISSHSRMLLSLVLLLLLHRVISVDVLSSLISLPFAGLRYFLSLLLAFVVLPVVDALVVAQTV